MKWWQRIPKKLIVSAIAVVVQFIPGLDADTRLRITAILAVFVGAQGAADIGKEKAKIETAYYERHPIPTVPADAPPPP